MFPLGSNGLIIVFPQVCQSRRNITARTANTSASGSPLKKPSSFPIRKEDIRLAVMIAIIFICFLLSFLPLMIVNVFDDDVSDLSLSVGLHFIKTTSYFDKKFNIINASPSICLGVLFNMGELTV